MCGGEFSNKSTREAWDFLGDVAEKSMQWETIRAPEVPTPSKGGIYPNVQVLEQEPKLSSVIRRLEALELRPTPRSVNQVASQPCAFCYAIDHSVENFPSDQACALYQKPRSDPFSPTYNQGWRQHPNLSHSTGPHQGGPQAQFHQQAPLPFQGQPQAFQGHQQSFQGPPQAFQGPPQRPFQPQSTPMNVQPNQTHGNVPPPGFSSEQDKRMSTLEKGMEILLQTSNSFMQGTKQSMNANTQAISCLEVQVGQLANALSERERGKFPSQPEPNPGVSQIQGQFQSHSSSSKLPSDQANAITELRYGRQVDNGVTMPSEETTREPTKPNSEPTPSIHFPISEEKA